jgi:hypothetical protein
VAVVNGGGLAEGFSRGDVEALDSDHVITAPVGCQVTI